MNKWAVIYDYYGEVETTYGCTIEFDTEEEALDWIAEGKDDPYTGNFQLVHPIED